MRVQAHLILPRILAERKLARSEVRKLGLVGTRVEGVGEAGGVRGRQRERRGATTFAFMAVAQVGCRRLHARSKQARNDPNG
jgi:hypothetical protein